MSTPVHKPKKNPLALLPFQDNEESEDEQIVTDEVVQKEEERELSDEEDFHDGDDNDNDDDDDDDEEGDEFGANVENNFDEDEFEVDFTTEEDDHDSLDDEEDEFRNASETEPGCFLPDQPYIPPPIVPKPASEPSSSNLIPYILSMFRDVSVIYLQFIILLILVYSCALMYVLYNNGNLTLWTDTDEDDIATCPVVYAYKYQIEE